MTRRAAALLRRDRAAIDLASIMVGVLVLGIIGGVIAAVVFAVIPWAQDNASSSTLSAIREAEQVALVRDGGYMTGPQLTAAKLLPAASTDGGFADFAIEVGDGCWVAASQSRTDWVFYTMSSTTTVMRFLPGDHTPNSCAPAAGLIPQVSDIPVESPGPGGPLPVQTDGP